MEHRRRVLGGDDKDPGDTITITLAGAADVGSLFLQGDNTASFAAVTASAFEIQASGDGAYPVADFQADGAFLPAVPEPTSGLMILGGFAALASGPPPLGALICAHRRPAARREARAGRPHSRLRADVLRRCRIGGKPFATIVRSSP